VPIRRLFAGRGFTPEDISVMALALAQACKELSLILRSDDPFIQAVARRVIEEAGTGERDPERLRDNVLRDLEDKQRQAQFQVP
jgi:hypothetical protein